MSRALPQDRSGTHGRSFAEALGLNIPQPYPMEFPRILDFINIMSLQSQVDPMQEVFSFAGNVSVKMGKIDAKEVIQDKDHLITIRQSPSNRLHSAVKYGNMDNTTLTTQKELWEEVQEMVGLEPETTTVPELSIRMRGMRSPVPKLLMDEPRLDGMDSIYQIQGSRGNYVKSYRERFGLYQLSNPTSMIRNELTERGLWTGQDARRLSSILRTESIIAGSDDTFERKGWEDLFQMPTSIVRSLRPHRFPPLAGQLNRELAAGKWHQDVGIPSKLTGRIDSLKMQAVVYLLAKRHKVVVI